MFKAFKVAKPSEPNRQSEDAVPSAPYSNNITTWFGIADGAGGEGFFCGEWAQRLIDELKNKATPFKNDEELDSWVSGFCDNFTQSQKDSVPENDIIAKNKFSIQGANSTLTAVWIENNRMGYINYGDSCVFVVRENQLITFPEMFDNDLTHFSGSTHLINSQKVLDGIAFLDNNMDFELFEEDTILLATDALSQFLILTHKANNNEDPIAIKQKLIDGHSPLANTVDAAFNLAKKRNFLSEIISEQFNETEFKELCNKLFTDKAILSDDYSLIIYRK